MKTLIVYHTKTGHTLEAVKPIVAAIKNAGAEAKVVLAKDFETHMISDCESLIIASPCWAGSIGVFGLARPLIDILKKIPDDSLKAKKIGGVAIHAKYGGEATLKHMEKLMAQKGGLNFNPAPVIKAGVLMSLYKGPSVSKMDEERLKKYGKEFVLAPTK